MSIKIRASRIVFLTPAAIFPGEDGWKDTNQLDANKQPNLVA